MGLEAFFLLGVEICGTCLARFRWVCRGLLDKSAGVGEAHPPAEVFTGPRFASKRSWRWLPLTTTAHGISARFALRNCPNSFLGLQFALVGPVRALSRVSEGRSFCGVPGLMHTDHRRVMGHHYDALKSSSI